MLYLVDSTGQTVAGQPVNASDMAMSFADMPGTRLYFAQLVREGDVIGSSGPVVLGKNGFWTPFLRVRIDPDRDSSPKSESAGEDGPQSVGRVDGDFSIEVVCPPEADFAEFCSELRTRLTQHGIRQASSIAIEDIDAYLTSYGYPEGGSALRGEPVARKAGRPVVYPGKRYVFVLRDHRLAGDVNAALVSPGGTP